MTDRLYSNYIAVETNLFDICVKFGLRDVTQAEQNEYDELVQIFLSPQHAKAFLNLLSAHISNYEDEFGEIRMPTPEVVNNEE